jgi:hypothetical protein
MVRDVYIDTEDDGVDDIDTDDDGEEQGEEEQIRQLDIVKPHSLSLHDEDETKREATSMPRVLQLHPSLLFNFSHTDMGFLPYDGKWLRCHPTSCLIVDKELLNLFPYDSTLLRTELFG